MRFKWERRPQDESTRRGLFHMAERTHPYARSDDQVFHKTPINNLLVPES